MPDPDLDPLDLVIGENLSRARAAKRMSREELARRVASITGTAFRQQAVFRIERGMRPLRHSEALAVAAVLGIDVATLTSPTGDTAAVGDYRRRIVQAATELIAAAGAVATHGNEYFAAVESIRQVLEDLPDEERPLLFTPAQWDAVKQALDHEGNAAVAGGQTTMLMRALALQQQLEIDTEESGADAE